VAVAAGALAAVLALAIAVALQGPHGTPGGATTLFAELQRSPAGQTADEHADAAAQPAFRVAVDTTLRSILITPLAARPVARRSYQLWLLADRAPLPLGIVAPAAATTLPWPTAAGEGAAALAPDAFLNASLAISLEPEGGSPTGAPSGPILYEGRLSRPK
jgi:anti-sigma-K factor RskA